MEPSDRRDRHHPAFLLIIPGAVVAGFGIGLAHRDPAPWLLIGAGIGFVLWGLIVALRR